MSGETTIQQRPWLCISLLIGCCAAGCSKDGKNVTGAGSGTPSPTPCPGSEPCATPTPTPSPAPSSTPDPIQEGPKLDADRARDLDAQGLPGIQFAKPASILERDDGYHSSSKVVRVVRNGSEWTPGVPRKVCGNTQAAVASRIADCASQHTVRPSWDDLRPGEISWNGARLGISMEGSWTLVTVYRKDAEPGSVCNQASCTEVWRDDRTGLLWSDVLGSANWCHASGASKFTDSDTYCAGVTYQDSTMPISLCAENADLNTPSQARYSGSFTYDDAKGGMRKSTTPEVRWRLPTLSDWTWANINGAHRVLPDIEKTFWSATLANGAFPPYARTFNGLTTRVSGYGAIPKDRRTDSGVYVRCVGR